MALSEKEAKHISKFMSLVLRHQPAAAGLTLDEEGWVLVDDLIAGLTAHGTPVTLEMIEEVVAGSDKQRFAFDESGERIRANQGHSVKVDLHFEPAVPPEFLFHGTAEKSVEAILAHGIQKRSRLHVHLSPDEPTAVQEGSRHGRPVVLRVRAGAMHRDGLVFYLSSNGVWLTEEVPPQFCERLAAE